MVHDNGNVKDFQKERDRRKTGVFTYDEGATVSTTVALNFPGRPYKGVCFHTGSGEELATAMRSIVEKQWGRLVAVDGLIQAYNGTCWVPVPKAALVRIVHLADGESVGERGILKVSAQLQAHALNLLANKSRAPSSSTPPPWASTAVAVSFSLRSMARLSWYRTPANIATAT
jgi:hypothetical protein